MPDKEIENKIQGMNAYQLVGKFLDNAEFSRSIYIHVHENDVVMEGIRGHLHWILGTRLENYNTLRLLSGPLLPELESLPMRFCNKCYYGPAK